MGEANVSGAPNSGIVRIKPVITSLIEPNVALAIVAVVAAAFAIREAEGVFKPLALALFIIAIVWPLQRWLEARMPKLIALTITLILIVAVCLVFASLITWGFGEVDRAKA
jgi:AI-2 transport protein TqsA